MRINGAKRFSERVKKRIQTGGHLAPVQSSTCKHRRQEMAYWVALYAKDSHRAALNSKVTCHRKGFVHRPIGAQIRSGFFLTFEFVKKVRAVGYPPFVFALSQRGLRFSEQEGANEHAEKFVGKPMREPVFFEILD